MRQLKHFIYKDIFFRELFLFYRSFPAVRLFAEAVPLELPGNQLIEVSTNGDKFWYQNGKLHRTDGPAIEGANGTKKWYQNDKLHRTDGPAIEWANGTKEWWKNNKLHRTDGPAVEWANGTKKWFQNGERSR